MNDIRCIDADALLTDRMKSKYYHLPNGDIAIPIIDIEHAPTIEPEREKGEWIPVTNGRGGHECNKCHNYAPAWQTGEERLTDFCPCCGADMRGEKDG